MLTGRAGPFFNPIAARIEAILSINSVSLGGSAVVGPSLIVVRKVGIEGTREWEGHA